MDLILAALYLTMSAVSAYGAAIMAESAPPPPRQSDPPRRPTGVYDVPQPARCRCGECERCDPLRGA